MRLAAVLHGNQWRIGLVSPDAAKITVLQAGLGTVDDVVSAGTQALAGLAEAADRPGALRLPLDEVTLGPPIRRHRRDVLCTGWNYWDHFEESHGLREGQEPTGRPEHPTFFTKAPDTVTGPYDDIGHDARLSGEWDYEVEVAVVIGRAGRSIPRERALAHVFGYCVANDVSLRDVQRAHGGQWFKGKSIDATMPLGPWLTTADEVEPAALHVECELNGTVVQRASTAQMAFSLADLISELSRGMTLHPGDLLLTGTPAGIGNARDPQLFLSPGDTLVSRVSGLGELRNRLVAANLVTPTA